jgi:hypothetical protein
MTTFSEKGKKITDKDVLNIENKIKCSFPEEYRNFLLKNNGGECEPCGFTFIEGTIDSESEVRSFFAIGGIDGDYDLEENINIYIFEEKRLPNFYFPIAEDDLGNLICISCNKSDNGYIYFWDHEDECDTENIDNYRDNMYLLAKSFNKFIKKLKDLD